MAKGFTLEEGIDYNEVFSLVVRHSSTHVLLSMVVWFNLELEQVDVTIAFLYETLDGNIYMKQPPDYVEEGK